MATMSSVKPTLPLSPVPLVQGRQRRLPARWPALTALALIVGVALLLGACGGGSPEPPAASEGSATLTAAAGGVVDGPDGVKLTVPAAALADTTTIRIARDGTGAPELGGARLITPVYAITPHGTAFSESALLSIPFKAADVAPGTQPILLKAQPGGTWSALASNLVGDTLVAADTPSLSYYAVGTCYTTRDVTPGGPDPLLYCPSAHQLTLTLQDNSGVAVPVTRNAAGTAQPAMTISQPTTLNFVVYWARPAGTSRSDVLNVIVSGAGLLPAQQPLRDFAVNNNNFSQPLQVNINPATVPGAGAAGGVVVRVKASASYTTDAFYPGCVCFKPASWTYETEVPVRVTYRGVQPTITQQPANAAVNVGQSASFTVGASGPNPGYRWLRNGLVIPGATSASYSTGALTLADNGATFTAEVCTTLANPVESVCVNSNPAQLTVSAVAVAPSFTTAPQSITVTEGETASFTAVASGQPAPTIAWSRLDTSGPFTTYTPVCTPATGSGSVTSATCNLGQVTRAGNGAHFIAAASNSAGSVDSGILTLTVLSVPPAPVAPTITSAGELRDQTINQGGSVSWTITATGTGTLSYSWFSVDSAGNPKAGVVCPDGSAANRATPDGVPTLTLTNLSPGCSGMRVAVRVGNSVGLATARIATLTVNTAPAAPQISVPLANRSVLDGTQVTFNVGATGTPSVFSYGWSLGGAAVPRVSSGCTANDAACSFTALLEDSGKTMAVTVANGLAPNAQSSATLTVTTNDVPASITAQPTSQSVVAGNSASFTIGTAGTPTPTVQWQTSSDGVAWADIGTGNSTTFSNTTLAQNGLRVRAIVRNTTRIVGGTQLNEATSNLATLSVVNNLPANALTAVQVLTVASRTMALRADGNVYAWGNYVSPVHGGYQNGGTPAYRPTLVQGLSPIKQVAIGSDYASWALGQDGTVWGWGFLNSYDAFAQGPSDNTLQFFTPVRLLTAANTPIDRVCQIEGTIYGVVMLRSDVVGGTCAANEPRSVWYTANITNQEPQAVRYATQLALLNGGGALLPAGRWIKEVTSSRNYGTSVMTVFAIANDGKVYAWGWNNQGQLGLGHTNAANTPQLAPGWEGATRISASGDATLALMPDGSLKGAGWNANASLGIGPVSYTVVSTPTTLTGISGAGDISTAYATSMALVGGELRYWGNGGRFAPGAQAAPIAIGAPVASLTSVSTGNYVAVAVGPGGAVYSWGDATLRGCTPNGTDCNAATTTPALVTLP